MSSGNFSEIDYSSLNEQQREVVFNASGASLVLAGPGSGKTRVLVYRVARLLEQGVSRKNILLLTFTNRAAKEMMRRISEITGERVKGLVGGTFHHIGNLILRKHSEALGFENGFSIIDSEDSRQLLKDVISTLFPEKDKHFPSVKVISTIISFSRNSLTKIEDCISQKFEEYSPYSKEILRISENYKKRKLKSEVVDFDDLLEYWNLILDNEKIREFYQSRFSHILVDEFQDTNKLQFDILRKLSGRGGNIMVVGDDSQSIYSFRAAEIRNILDFPEEYSDSKEFKLEENYRSTPEILELINESIKNNSEQFEKELFTENSNGEKPRLVRCDSVSDEARFVCDEILKLSKGEYYSGSGVLFRADYQSAELELELIRRGIPYKKRGGLKFFEQAHIKDLTAFLKIVSNQRDELAWKRILCLFEGIGATRALKIYEWVSKTRDPLSKISKPENQLFAGKDFPGWIEFKKFISKIPKTKNPAELAEFFNSEFFGEYLKDNYSNFKSRSLDVLQYLNLASKYNEVGKFLEDVILDADLTNSDSASFDDGEDSEVVISTIHQAKGLEWKNVFVLSLAEGRFPLSRTYEDGNIEEERRLFYVACSRAKERLYLISPLEEFTYWSGSKVLEDSIFIDELPEDCYEEIFVSEDNGRREEYGGFVSADEL